MPLRDKRHFVFDMDGTLTIATHDFDAMRDALGLPPDSSILEGIAARPAAEQPRLHRRLHELELDYARRAQPQPGAAGLLQRLRRRDASLAILTRNDKALAGLTLEVCGLREFFPDELILGREEHAPKPAPDGILHLMQHWQAAPASTVMVGDYVYDLKAGRAAGVTTVHFDEQGLARWPELSDITVQELSELAELLGD
ncbi:HAD family hydrolase [Granulosicoccaceae sp. 1_MG-2023]|nr:HAD family hydrolase [Granulosicoccaceae sp. 1_MG-2023]